MILDCTLRDGGYRNGWDFSAEFVSDYLETIEKSGIGLVEMGLRLIKQGCGYGELAYCRDKYLESLNIRDGLQIAVMIKAEELLEYDVKDILDRLFADKKTSRIDIVRVAVPLRRAMECREICENLKNKGYKVALNLTKIDKGAENDVLDAVKAVKRWGCFDILYFADTFGQFCPDDVKAIADMIKQEYRGMLGFHGHNDKGLALKNSLIALENGVDIIDSTLSGIGKGAGNLSTEIITAELNAKYGHKFRAIPLMEAG